MNSFKQQSKKELFKFYKELTKEQRKTLKNQVRKIDFKFMEKIYNNSFFDEKIEIDKISSLKIITNLSTKQENEYLKIGKKLVSNNEYAVVLMAGGFGSRLGLDYPKGCLKLNINNKKISLFEIYINRLKEANKECNSNIKLYIMTSTENNDFTVNFFEENNYFDYEKENIKFFIQDNKPILDKNGKMLLKSKYEVLLGPNGNGDVYNALRKSGLIKKMKKENIKFVLFTMIDNVASNIVDYSFIGAMIKNNYKLSSKTLFKENEESLDYVFCKYNNKPYLLPSRFITKDITNKKDKNGNFLYRETNIAYHLIHIDYVEKFSKVNLKYNRAFKKNNYIDNNGNLIKPDKPNSFKFEKFIFDAFYYADDMLLYRINKKSFCPIKKIEDIKKAENFLKEISNK